MLNGTPEQRWQTRIDDRATNLSHLLEDRLKKFEQENEGHYYTVRYADPELKVVSPSGQLLDFRNLIQVRLTAPDNAPYTYMTLDLTEAKYGSESYLNMMMDEIEVLINTHLNAIP